MATMRIIMCWLGWHEWHARPDFRGRNWGVYRCEHCGKQCYVDPELL